MTEHREARLVLALLFLAALALRSYLFLSTGYTADDALITIRYAENLSGGRGFVYNDGEKVLGTTTPLLTLVVALLLKLKMSGLTACFLLNQIADLFTAFFLYRIYRRTSSPLSWLPSALFLFNPESIQWSLSGMETEISIALIFASIYFSSTDRWNPAFLVSGLAVLTRVDAVAVPVALTAVYVFRFKKLPLIPLATLAAVVLPWILFAMFYFGSAIPNSAMAKASLIGTNYLGAFRNILLRGFLHLHTVGIPFLILALLGTWSICRDQRELLVLPVWTWGYALSYTLAAGGMHPWYYAPFYAGYLALNYSGFLYLASKIPVQRSVWAARIASVIAIVIVLYLSYLRVDRLKEMQAHLNAMNKAVGIWMNENSPSEAVFAVKDIGYMGYYSQRKVLDLAGLVSPESVSYRTHGDFLGPIRKYRPDYFAFSAGQIRTLKLKESGLLNDYEVAETIQNPFGSYTIFRLTKNNAEQGD